jgi:hypothetical protein
MPLSKKASLVALTLFFWIAQVQGTLHGISHLGRDAGMHDQPAPHAVVCSDCVGYAQAGAAPLPAPIDSALLVLADSAPALISLGPRALELAHNYQSRAPPATSI